MAIEKTDVALRRQSVWHISCMTTHGKNLVRTDNTLVWKVWLSNFQHIQVCCTTSKWEEPSHHWCMDCWCIDRLCMDCWCMDRWCMDCWGTNCWCMAAQWILPLVAIAVQYYQLLLQDSCCCLLKQPQSNKSCYSLVISECIYIFCRSSIFTSCLISRNSNWIYCVLVFDIRLPSNRDSMLARQTTVVV